MLSRCHWSSCLGILAALAVLVSGTASAELNLWVSYHFEGIAGDDAGSYKDAERLLLQALEEDEAAHRAAATLDGLGQVYTALGDFELAEQYYREALARKERSLGKSHRDVAQTLNNLADLLYLKEAGQEVVEPLYRRALAINERDQRNLEVCRSLNGIAILHHDRDEMVEAEALLNQAAALHDKAHRRDHPYLATVLTNLGILYLKQERYEEAAPVLERAQYIQDKVLRAGHPDAAVRMHAAANLKQAMGEKEAAAELARQAEAIREAQADSGNLY